MISGVPDHVDGRMLADRRRTRARTSSTPTACGTTSRASSNWDPIWADHGIRILPGPSSLWLDARGRRLPVPLFPGFDTLGTLEHIMTTGHDHTWFVLTQKIIEKEFALSGSEQNPDITEQERRARCCSTRVRLRRARRRSRRSSDHGADFVVERDLRALVAGMNALTDEPLLDAATRRARGRRPRPRDRPTRTPRTCRSPRSAARAATSPTASPASPRRTACSTRRPAR